MYTTITPSEMKKLENDLMQAWNLPGALLMEHAAQGITACLQRRVPQNTTVLFLCGPGNNGGDGYAAARLWQAAGGRSVIWELSSNAQGDALMNRRLVQSAGIPVVTLESNLPPFPPCSAIVDALFGTGLSRPIDGIAEALIRQVNAQQDAQVIAVDIPSGIDGLTGTICGDVAIRAQETVTFHRIKQGLLLRCAPDYTGQITVQPILIPDSFDQMTDGLFCLTPQDIASMIAPRSAVCHKGDYGRVVILAGSPGMAGAAAFCASACVKAGAGLTTILCRESLLPVLQSLCPEATCLPLPERSGQLLAQAADTARKALSGARAACIGCGLGQTLDLLPILRVFRDASCPVVWDADALNLLAHYDGLLPLHEQDVMTPHPGEAARLLECSVQEINADPLSALESLHELCGCTVLLKGARSLMTDGITTFINLYGSPALAKGGSGDVLAGVIAALLARPEGFSSVKAAALGALLHGMAGIRAHRRFGENCSTPQALLEALRLDAKDF